MKQLLFSLLLLSSLSFSLLYSSLEMHVIDQNGMEVKGVDFFLECKMTLNTVERYLCSSGVNGTCISECMDCLGEEGATVRASYLNQTVEQEIPVWGGTEGLECETGTILNPLGTFIVHTEAPPEEQEVVHENQTLGENIPEEVNIETQEYYLSTPEEELEYDSYIEGPEEEEPEEDICLPAFILPALLIAICIKR